MILRKGGKNIQKKVYKKDLNDPDNHDSVVTRLRPESQSVKSNGPQEASLQQKLVEMMEFQFSYFSPKR